MVYSRKHSLQAIKQKRLVDDYVATWMVRKRLAECRGPVRRSRVIQDAHLQDF